MASVQDGKLFSCGNHSLEITKGMLHFGDPNVTICIVRVPTTMTLRDIIQFLSPSMPDIENTRILREVNLENNYIVLLNFRELDKAKEFFKNYNGKCFNSLEENICKLLYVTRIETFSEDPSKIDEAKSKCAVCLDMMYPDVESIVTILCNHSFHVYCLSKWADTSCPVCRYCQTPENQIESKCMICSYEGESLWMCIICGYVACGRYINGHAYDHFLATQHTYAMQLTDNQVWDYAGDNYVHRLLANKTDGKPVEVEGADNYRQVEEKMEAVQLEYTYLLTQQLESQRKYYEKLKDDTEKQCQKKLKDMSGKLSKANDELNQLRQDHEQLTKDRNALDKKFQTVNKKLAKIQQSLNEEKEMNKCLTLNQEQLQKNMRDKESALDEKQKEITDLEEQLRDLMFFMEARDKIERIDETIDGTNPNEVSKSEIETGRIVMEPSPSTSRGRVKQMNRRNKR